jgi:hypothetical protein
MWNSLSPADIEQAKRDIARRREETLARQAEEIRGLAAEEAEIDTLDRLAAAFVRRFKTPPTAGAEQAPAAPPAPLPEPRSPTALPEPAAVAARTETATEPAAASGRPEAPLFDHAQHPGGRRPGRPGHGESRRHGDDRPYAQTNFDVFSRALTKL